MELGEGRVKGRDGGRWMIVEHERELTFFFLVSLPLKWKKEQI